MRILHTIFVLLRLNLNQNWQCSNSLKYPCLYDWPMMDLDLVVNKQLHVHV
jgi:hypothetical protein